MFESFVPDSGTSLDSSLNPSLTGLTGNLEPMDSITPQCAVKKLTAGGSSPELLDTTLRSPGSDDSSILLPKSFLSQSFDAPATNPSSVDPLTGMGTQVPEIVEQAVQLTYDALTGFAISSDFDNKMNQAFGDSFDTTVSDAIANQFAQGDFSDIPEIEILSAATMNGANGAFSEATNKIYLSREFVATNAGNVDAIAGVVLEETGHYIDSKINVKDAAGDEGDIFSRIVQGKEISASEFVALKAEEDTAIIRVGGKDILIEQSLPSTNEQWDRASGDDTLFDGNLSNGESSPEVQQVYRNLVRTILGREVSAQVRMTAGYAFDQSYRNGFGKWHAGIDIGAPVGTPVRAAVGGTLIELQRNPEANNRAVGIQGTDGNLWVYGHLQNLSVPIGSRISTGQQFASIGNPSAPHLHLEVQSNTRTYKVTNGAHPDQNFVLRETMSPLQAFWQLGGNVTPPPPPPSSAFRGTVDAPVNIRSGPGTNFSIVGSLSTGNSRTFDSVARGTSHYDSREQRDDNRWFRIQGTNNWVSGAFITGNPLFNGSVDASVNVRSGPGTNFSIVGSLSTGNSQTFDATTVGTTHWDTREGRNENRWFRIQNTDRWVSAAFITGNPTY